MGVSVYYTCVREYSFTNQEKQEVAAVIDRYNRAFDMKDSGEIFSMYRYDEHAPTVIFEGATKLPFSDDLD